MSFKKWIIKHKINDETSEFLKEKNFKPLLSFILASRNIKTAKDFDELTKDEDNFPDAFYFKDMQKAINRIKYAIKNKELICVFGDYDADGITSTAIMVSFLREKKANVIYYIPRRDSEGYGLSTNAVANLAEQGVDLIITVDTGITGTEEIKLALSYKIDTIVIDHHNVPEDLPEAFCVVNPHQKDCHSVFKHFCGASLAFLLVINFGTKNISKYAEMAAIGTIADLVPLLSYNKKIVNLGIESLSYTNSPGLVALKKKSSLEFKNIKSTDIAFLIAPKINACGRLSSSEIALKLLLCEDFLKASELAKELTQQNTKRKQIESEILKSSFEFISLNPHVELQNIIVIAAENIHNGVIGIVASKLVEKYSKPCIVISIEGDVAKASGRSVAGFSLINAVNHCKSLLLKSGGHPMACGFEIKTRDIKDFVKKINDFSKEELKAHFAFLEIDCEIMPKHIDLESVEELCVLEPFGSGNESPIFCMRNLKISEIISIGNGNHLKINFSSDISALMFNTSKQDFEYKKNEEVDIAFCLAVSEFRGRESVSIFIKDIRPSKMNVEKILSHKKEYEKVKYNLLINETIENCNFVPNRDDFILVYQYLKCLDEYNFYSKENIYHKLNNKDISFSKFLIILDVMQELNLINTKVNKNLVRLKINNSKNSLENSKILENLTQKV